MSIDKDYAENIREGLSVRAFRDEAVFRAETQIDVNAGYFGEVEHVGKSLFGADFSVRRPTARAKNEFGQKLPKGWRQLGHDTNGKRIENRIEPYCGNCRIGVRGESYCTCGKEWPV